MALGQVGFGGGGNVIALGVKFILASKRARRFCIILSSGLTPANFCAILQWWNGCPTIVK